MARVGIRITGGDRLRKLSKLDVARVGNEAMKSVYPIINRAWAEEARQAAPVRTKFLRDTIQAGQSRSGFRINMVFYGVILNARVRGGNRYHSWAVNALIRVLNRPAIQQLIAEAVNTELRKRLGVL